MRIKFTRAGLWSLAAACLISTHGLSHAVVLDKNAALKDPNFQRYVVSKPVLAHSKSFSAMNDQLLGIAQNCTSERVLTPLNINILKDVGMRDPKTVNDGAWVLRYSVQRCGEAKVYNTIYIGTPTGQLVAKPYIAGTTIADFQLVNDVMLNAKTAAATTAGAPSCERINIFDTSVEQWPSPNAKLSPWSENWDVLVCEKKVRVPITFTPQATGGVSFSISLKRGGA